MVAILDSHVHDRGWEESYKDTPAHALEVARDCNYSGFFVMPNTKPPILTEELALARIKEADDAGVPEVFYGVFMGLTSDKEQVKRAVAAYRKHFPRIVGFKMYAGNSHGGLGVTNVNDQFYNVYIPLAEEGYDGVLALHCEKENRMVHSAWNKMIPVSHVIARPEIAEVESIRDQILFAYLSGFKGKLHIAHISTPMGVREVNMAQQRGQDVSCGVTPTHIIYDWRIMTGNGGIMYKMNPALRGPGAPEEMLELLRQSKINYIESDHAPHTWEDKEKECSSGMLWMPWMLIVQEFLRQNKFTEQQIEDVFFNNVVKRYGVDIPINRREVKDRRADYGYNPHRGLELKVGWVWK